MTDRTPMLSPFALALMLGCGFLRAQGAENEAHIPAASSQPPVLSEPRSLAGMNLDFSHRVRLGEVLAALSKQSGIKILLHGSVSEEATTSADLRGMTFRQALDALMLQNDLFYKVMDPATLMVFKSTPRNRQDFEDRSIRTFRPVHADVDNLRQVLGTLMPGIRVYTDKRLNAITLMGNAVDMARTEQVVRDLDQARGEVRLQMEVLEVSHKAAVAAGLLPDLLAAPSPGGSVAVLEALAKAMREGDGHLLASPDVRVVSGEDAAIRISHKALPPHGGKGAATPRSAPGGKAEEPRQASPEEDLGLKVKAKPTVHPNREITLALAYELVDPSEVGEPGRPGISDRVIKTTLALKDGETIVLGGLLDGDGGAAGGHGGKEARDRLLVVKAVLLPN